jgi:hypothetical protein
MLRRSKSAPIPGHWSRDYVEHLRTVHFALLTISVGLIAILSSESFDAGKAHTQIEELLQIKSWWTQDGLFTHLPNRVGLPPRYIPRLEGDFIQVAASSELEVGGDQTLVLTLPDWYWCVGDDEDPFNAPKDFPNSVRDLERWWNQLRVEHNVFKVRSIYPGVAVGREKNKHEVRQNQLYGRHARRVELAWTNACLPSKNHTLTGMTASELYTVDIAQFNVAEVNRRILQHYFIDLLPGPYENTFKDLIRAARSGEDLSLETMERRIADIAAKGEVFEIFGLKFPAQALSTQGIIVLLSVQLYLFLYLKRLSNQLKPGDPGWDTPWIAMDRSITAQFCVFVTFILLPVIAVGLAGYQATGLTTSGWSYVGWVQRCGIAWPFVTLLASLCLGVCGWMYRPRLKEPPPPSWMVPY